MHHHNDIIHRVEWIKQKRPQIEAAVHSKKRFSKENFNKFIGIVIDQKLDI